MSGGVASDSDVGAEDDASEDVGDCCVGGFVAAALFEGGLGCGAGAVPVGGKAFGEGVEVFAVAQLGADPLGEAKPVIGDVGERVACVVLCFDPVVHGEPCGQGGGQGQEECQGRRRGVVEAGEFFYAFDDGCPGEQSQAGGEKQGEDGQR